MMKLSARNQIKGKVTEVIKGQTTGHVHIDIGNGVTVHASITNEAIDDLALKVGDDAWAVVSRGGADDVPAGERSNGSIGFAAFRCFGRAACDHGPVGTSKHARPRCV